MIGIGSLIVGAVKAGARIYGGIKQKKAANRQKKRIQELQNDNEDWFNRRYNEDTTQRADAQRLITLTQEAMRRNNRALEGQASVAGATTESVAAAKAANNQMVGDTVSQIAANTANRKDAIEQQYMSNKQALAQELNALDNRQARNTASAVRGTTNEIAPMAENLNKVFGKK